MAVTSNAPSLNKGKMQVSQTGFAASGDAGVGIHIPPRAKKISVQTVGTYTGALSLQVQGSNDNGTTWNDTGVTAFTADAIRDVPVFPDLLRIAATAGAGGANAAAHVVVYFD